LNKEHRLETIMELDGVFENNYSAAGTGAIMYDDDDDLANAQRSEVQRQIAQNMSLACQELDETNLNVLNGGDGAGAEEDWDFATRELLQEMDQLNPQKETD
jgi:hypothetical protein